MPDEKNGTLETILVVDQSESVLHTVSTLLKTASFQVLSARDSPRAIEISAQRAGLIHLLLCEVDLPNSSGPGLATELKKTRPDLLVMLMSGQENGNLLVLNYGWAYIHKDLLAVKLVRMVTDVLHTPDRSQLGDEFDSTKDSHPKLK